MPLIVYLTEAGDRSAHALRVGQSLMDGAVQNAVPGIMAECGGSCICATCHVYIEGGPVGELPPIGDAEDATLDDAPGERRANSRLSCQIRATAELDGLIVRVAANR